jgi:hypothetical protein
MIRNFQTANNSNALIGEGRVNSASEVKIDCLLNQISEKEDLHPLANNQSTQVLNIRNKASDRLYFSERPTSATNS